MKAWACDRCQEIHTQNPNECRNCGYGIFRPASEDELRERSTGVDTPDSVPASTTVGKAKEPDVDGSPGVALDGSIEEPNDVQEDSDQVGNKKQSAVERVLSWIRG